MTSFLIFRNDKTGNHFSVSEGVLTHLPATVDAAMIQKYGLPQGNEVQLDVPFTKHIYVTYDGTQYLETSEDILEGFSVYDYISETPTVLVDTDSTEDVIVSTVTDPFTIYDEFGDSVEVLYYTDDETVTEANLIVTANWSPLDELEGDFEIVTWTDESPETAKRVLEITAVPKPQFIYLLNSVGVFGELGKVLIANTSIAYRDELRILFTPNQTDWYRWDGATFIKVNITSAADAKTYGMKHAEVAAMTEKQLTLWPFDKISVGLYLEDNVQDTIITSVNSIAYEDLIAKHSSSLKEANLYILNTTAVIDLEFVGSTVFGVLNDADLSRVQYRVVLNDEPYFPQDGKYTELAPAPMNIQLELRSSDIKINDWNTIKVEFRDSFGTVDYWAKSFVGTYNGLMFKDLEGEFYSDEIGQVLKYLDFGVIYAGQTTIEHEIILRNQYGYAVKDVQISVNQSQMLPGMQYELSKTSAPFVPTEELLFEETLDDQNQLSFFIRLKTDLAMTPETNGQFKIVAKANKA
ncbi:hypothetical protein [Lysinibacillus fusiformis]|uniref:hypothetical protein n=1 Tax=Lysinibacillus fusiformis TaxID=28031 RepID=UPI002E1AFCD2|nr:hypothetical protein [Lysinibacillus fusiformis]